MTQIRNFQSGFFATKLGMSHIFNNDGTCLPVTLLKIDPSYITQVKVNSTDGYNALQLGFKSKKQQRVNKPLRGHMSSAGQGCFYNLREIRFGQDYIQTQVVGDEYNFLDLIDTGDFVDVTSKSIGRGFSGVVRRYGMKGQPATRGTHEDRRNVGSVGCRKTPGRIFKNKRMPGRYGGKSCTVQNLKVIKIDTENGIVALKGAVPGSAGSIVRLLKSIKKVKANS
jgi:large subunit ribosomal protein L3